MSDSKIQQRVKNRKEILPNTLYSLCELADVLSISNLSTLKLLQQRKIKYKRLGEDGKGHYRILGAWIIEYLEKKL